MNWMLPPGHMLRQHTTFLCLFVRTGVCVRVFGNACGDPRGTPLASPGPFVFILRQGFLLARNLISRLG